jgi:hypothetical protein
LYKKLKSEVTKVRFRNATTATQQKLGLIAAQQHSYELKHGAIPTRQKPSFEQWFLLGMRKYESKGVEFLFLTQGLVRIQWPGQPAVLRTKESFREEYDELFPSQKVTFEVQFSEENAGINTEGENSPSQMVVA